MRTTRTPRSQIRILTSIFASLLAPACVGTVGEGQQVGDRTKPTTTVACAKPEKVERAITIRSDADFAGLPDGCWDLWGTLRVEGPAITSLAGLGTLVGVNQLEIVGTSLTSIDTPETIKVYGALTVSNNARLTGLAKLAFDNADDLTTAYTVRNNPALTNLDRLAYVQASEGDLRITDNPALAAITLDELARVDGALVIANTGATRIDLGAITKLGRVEIASNPKLTALDGPSAATLEGDLVVRGNPALTTLGSFGALTTVEGAITIDDNDALASLEGLSSLQYVASSLAITNNGALAALGRVSRVLGVGGTLTITGNANLAYCAAHEVDHCVPSGVAAISGNKPDAGASCACWCQ